ncbi:LysR family transcriptional regulator [Candidimonas nitroreducens]|uniref:LysR family transcriptional regulator n=1 Tax=Candidimonas nitroreducens TaxID=683354 RepID=A0A225M0C5_9BURK|nr:LysR family transcriptional regulator [Candidimonas nitroreducens]OWT54834.1 LysR family transcriptional regulator [Candidimonas nitroreducens]
MNIKNFDLNLLRVFVVVYRLRSVSRAASTIGLTQPAMSNALRRLREQCNDPLFTRSGRTMEPTALANSLFVPLESALANIETCFTQVGDFRPESSHRTFRLLLSDVGEMIVLPRLMLALSSAAPGVSIEASRLPHADYAPALRSGQADLAIGNIGFLHTGFYQQHLFDDRYLCIARKDHPQLKGKLTLARYLSLRHVVSTAGSTDTLVDEALSSSKQRRNIKLTVTHYHRCAAMVMQSDLIATVPGNTVAGMPGLETYTLPFKMPHARVRQFWHRRAHTDAAHIWLRQLIAELILD